MADSNPTSSRSAFAQIFGTGSTTEKTERSSTPTARSRSAEKDQAHQKEAAAKKASDPRPSTPAAPREVERIDAVRDLLFGDQVGELKDSIEAIERRLVTRIAKLEDDSRSQIDNSERRLREQMEALGQDLRTEAEARSKMSKEVVTRLDASTLDLTNKINNLGDELRKRIERETGELRETLSDRSALSAMFADLSQQLARSKKPKA